MSRLLKADFYRMFRDKNLYISIFITIALTLFVVITYTALSFLLKNTEVIKEIEAQGINPSLFKIRAYDLFAANFSLSSNGAIVYPIFVGIFLVKDFKYGTIRNKLINGYSRLQVYLSLIISGIVYGFILLSISVVLSLMLGIPLFEFKTSEVTSVLLGFVVGFFLYLFIFSLLGSLVVAKMNLAIGLIITLITSIIGSTILTALRGINKVLDHIINCLPYGQAMLISAGDYSYLTVLVETVLVDLVLTFLVIYLGYKKFSKVDIK